MQGLAAIAAVAGAIGNIPATRGDGRETLLPGTAIRELAESLSGLLLQSGCRDYESAERIEAIRRIYAAIEPHTTGFYTNLHEDTERRTWGNYGANHARLVQIKNRYDPTNPFRLNANIKPTTGDPASVT
jgi:hypothetical protein